MGEQTQEKEPRRRREPDVDPTEHADADSSEHTGESPREGHRDVGQRQQEAADNFERELDDERD